MTNYKRFLALLIISAVSALMAMGLSHGLSFIDGLERWSEDFRVAAFSPATNSDSDIIILAIDEQTLAKFQYRSPINREFISQIVSKLDAYGAKAIGIDILFDQPTEPAKDDGLFNVLKNTKTPVVVAFAEEDAKLTEDQVKYSANFVPDQMRGMVNLIKEGEESIVRWAYPGKQTRDGKWTESFSFALAKKLGSPVAKEPIRISWANRLSEEHAFKVFPAQAIEVLPGSWFRDKIVLIGTMLPGSDRHRTPFTTTLGIKGEMPGILIHAHILDQVLNKRSIDSLSPTASLALIIGVSILAALLASVNFSILGLVASFLGCLVLVWGAGIGIISFFGILTPLIAPTLGFTFSFWGTEAYFRREEWGKRKIIRKLFSLYLSEELVSHLLANPDEVKLGGERRTMSYLFTDIADFTTIAENSDPMQIATLLNAYLDGICNVIISHGGTVNDFIGDAVFAVFNAPTFQDDHATLALKCAKDIDDFAEKFRHSTMGREFNLGITRIGLHTGPAAIGNMGSAKRLKYTPIGDSVNTAARIESLNKHIGTRICASVDVINNSDYKAVRPVGEFKLKGRKKPLKLFEVLSEDNQDQQYLESYNQAYDAMSSENKNTKQLFEKLIKQRPNDPVVRFHLTRLIESPCGAVITMENK